MKNDHDLAALQRLQPKRNARGAASPEFPTGVRGGCVLRGARGALEDGLQRFSRVFLYRALHRVDYDPAEVVWGWERPPLI